MRHARTASATVLLLALATSAQAQRNASVEIRAWAVEKDGRATVASRASVTTGVGGATAHLGVGMGIGPCSTTLGGVASRTVWEATTGIVGPLQAGELGGRAAWVATVVLSSVRDGEARLDVGWTRHEDTGEGLRRVGTRSETLILRQGDPQGLSWFPLDLVEETGPESCPNRRVLLGLSAELIEDPALADVRLEYDLWWEHADAAGNTTTRRLEFSGGQGEARDLHLAPMRWPAVEDARFDNILAITGQIAGRITTEGALEATLDVQRWVDAELAGRPRSGGVVDGGRKVFTLADGETVRMELPPLEAAVLGDSLDGAHGHMMRGPLPAPLPPSLRACDVVIDAGDYYEGHTDALVLTVRRLD